MKTAPKAESGNLGEVLGSVVSVQTQLHVEEHPGMALPTNLPAKLQLSSSVKTDERVDESSEPRSRKTRARSSVVLCPGDAATPNPLTSSAGPAAQIDTPVPPDVLLLNWTRVSDNAVPTGYEREFATLEISIQKASESALRLSTRMNNMTSAVWLHQREERLNSTSRLKKLSEDQFLLAAQTRPTRFRAKWQQSYYDGPTARRDAEEALRSKWVEILASLLRGTLTPMGDLLNKGATTLRARGRTLKKYIAWLALAHEVTFPSEVRHLSEFLQMRHSEPCTRGGLKSTHQALVFMEDIAAVEAKLAQVPLYSILYKELLSSTLTGGNQRQVPRFPTVMVQALEDTVVGETVRPYFQVYAWWLLLQCWATLRFSDHRGLIPDEKFTTRLLRSKTIGSDKTVTSRNVVVVSQACFVKRSEWLSCGWALLKQHADYPRDYLLPMPSGNYKRVCPQGTAVRYSACSSDQGLTKSESEGRTFAQPTDCAVLDTSLRTKFFGQCRVSSRCLETRQRHARRLGGAAKRPLHPCQSKPHHARREANGRSPHES